MKSQVPAGRVALWYIFSILRNGELTTNARSGFDLEASRSPTQDVVQVEIV
jgi:hypothetical protein